MASRGQFALCVSLLAGLCQAGCGPEQDTSGLAENRRLAEQNLKLQNELLATQQQMLAMQKNLQALQGLGDKRMDLLFKVASLEIGGYTAGYDSDRKPGDDGVRVYLLPTDRDGHTLKAAGTVTIQLYDLANPPERSRLAQLEFPVEDCRKHWLGGFMANHYRFECPFQALPGHNEITVRAVFVDYLTGQAFTAQKVVTVKLPLTSQPATAPASQAAPSRP